MSERPGPDAGDQLFDDDARALAAEHHRDSHYRWLTLSADREAQALRRVLNASWQASGHSRLTLRKGLEHGRWGQHIGAMAQLLTLGFLSKLGLTVESEPRLAERTPDLLLSKGGYRALVEVRSMAGCGEQPWAAHGGSTHTHQSPVFPGQVPSEQAKRQRARRRAQERAEAQAAVQKSLADSVALALQSKAEKYRELALSQALPLVVCLYQDTDTQIAQRVIDWGFGRASKSGELPGGAFAHQGERLSHLSAVLVLGRTEQSDRLAQGDGPDRPHDAAVHALDQTQPASNEHTVTLRGQLILNPQTTLLLAEALRPAGLSVFARDEPHDAPRWSHPAPPRIEL